MPFFIPSGLIAFRYLGGDPLPEKEAKLYAPYEDARDFAFFVANFGYSKSDYDSLTQTEAALIRKAWEDKQVLLGSIIYNACFTAVYNAMRKKGKPALKLWKKKSTKKADVEYMRNTLAIAKEIEEAEGKDWVKKIMAASGKMGSTRRKAGEKNTE